MGKWTVPAIVLGVLVVFGGVTCNGYQATVNADENVQKAWGNVESSYQRRTDLVPNLVKTVQGYAEHETDVFESVTKARAEATQVKLTVDDLSDPAKVEAYERAQAGLGASLGKLLAISENYPQLQSAPLYQDLMSQLEGTENRINVARQNYNDAVATYNKAGRGVMTGCGAKFAGYQHKESFKAAGGADQAPRVDFGKK